MATRYLEHPYAETRVLAAKHASVYALSRVVDDPAGRARHGRLPAAGEPHPAPEDRPRPARAHRGRPNASTAADLAPMIEDEDYYVRLVVARRAPDGLLPRLIADRNRKSGAWSRDASRRACSAPSSATADPLVRIVVAERLPVTRLRSLVADPDLRVRYSIAERADAGVQRRLLDDREPTIAAFAAERLASLGKETGHGPGA